MVGLCYSRSYLRKLICLLSEQIIYCFLKRWQGQTSQWVWYSENSEFRGGSEVAQLCPTLCNPMDCSPPGSSIHGVFQARVLEWIAISFSRGSSWPRDWTRVSCIAGRRCTIWATREALRGGNGHKASSLLQVPNPGHGCLLSPCGFSGLNRSLACCFLLSSALSVTSSLLATLVSSTLDVSLSFFLQQELQANIPHKALVHLCLQVTSLPVSTHKFWWSFPWSEWALQGTFTTGRVVLGRDCRRKV